MSIFELKTVPLRRNKFYYLSHWGGRAFGESVISVLGNAALSSFVPNPLESGGLPLDRVEWGDEVTSVRQWGRQLARCPSSVKKWKGV